MHKYCSFIRLTDYVYKTKQTTKQNSKENILYCVITNSKSLILIKGEKVNIHFIYWVFKIYIR